MQPTNQVNPEQPEESALLKFRRKQAAQRERLAAAGGEAQIAPNSAVEEKKQEPAQMKQIETIVPAQPVDESKDVEAHGPQVCEDSICRAKSPRAAGPTQDKAGIVAIRAELQKRFPHGLGYQLAPYEAELQETHLDLASLVAGTKEQKEKAQYFCCSICSMIVVDPVECGDCNTAYCRGCLAPWAERGGSCPKRCQGDRPVKMVEMHRYAKQDLKALVFRCRTDHCSHKATYDQALRHIDECKEKFVKCAHGCGAGILPKHQRYHDYFQCPKFQIKCDVCDYNLGYINGEGADYEDKPHDCLKYLKQRVHDLELGIGPSSKGDEHVPGYDLAMNFCAHCDSTLRKYVHLPSNYTNGAARCDRCKTQPLDQAAFYFHCDDCNFDLCFHCSLATQGKLPNTSMRVQVSSLDKTFIMSQTPPAEQDYPIECCRGNECISKSNQGHITDHFWYENAQDSEDVICVHCLVALYEA